MKFFFSFIKTSINLLTYQGNLTRNTIINWRVELVNGKIYVDDLSIIKMEKNLKIGIIGAGIQGVCNALFLQKKGYQVTLFDKDGPDKASASYGNAGHFSPYASIPLNRPDILTDIPAMLLSSSGPLAL